MSLYGKCFVYNNNLYPFRITNIDTKISTEIGGNFDIDIYKSKNQIYNLVQNIDYKKPLEIDIEMIGDKPLLEYYCEKLDIDMPTTKSGEYDLYEKICNNLFGQKDYKKFVLYGRYGSLCSFEDILEDFEGDEVWKTYDYFNCILTEGERIEFNGKVYGFKCKMICDAPNMWRDETHTFDVADEDIELPVTRGFTKYILPNVTIYSGATAGEITLSNDVGNTKIQGLGSNEVIRLYSNPRKITSSATNDKLDDFNMVWVKLDYSKTIDTFTLTGNVTSIKFDYRRAIWIDGN